MQVADETTKKEIAFQLRVVFYVVIIVLFLCLVINNYISLIYMKVQKESYDLVIREGNVAFPEFAVLNSDTVSPIFVHIPKTGGTSIENSLHQKDIEVGKYLNYSHYPYEVADVACSPWHKPPLAFVKNSFSIVREPFSRLESEFKWCLREGAEWCKNVSDDLSGYQEWIVFILKKARIQYEIGDCHFIPQWHFARWVTVKLPFSQLQKEEFWDLIRRYYNLTEITQMRENSNPSQNGSYVDSLSLKVKRMVKFHFREDFQFLSKFW